MTSMNNEPDMTTCDRCAKDYDFNTLTLNRDQWLCEKCDENVANIRVIKEEYDDKGVLCRYLEDDGWYAVEDHCVDCGYRCDDCDCETDEAWVFPCEECGDCDQKCSCSEEATK